MPCVIGRIVGHTKNLGGNAMVNDFYNELVGFYIDLGVVTILY
jgi:hypothetical protein